MFEKFAQSAREAVVQAQQAARATGARRLGTEHLLLALADGDSEAAEALRAAGATPIRLRDAVQREDDVLDAEALRSIGVDLAAVREAAEAAFGPGALDAPASRPRRSGKHVSLTHEAKKSIENALRLCLRTGGRRIEAEHLLLAVLMDGRYASVLLLIDEGVDVPVLAADVTRRLEARAA
ncbi:Clp protease N-terminal domain-containing protein [Actinomadura rayongensis]|uniref:Clp R domain-containing protein n=1 Tax=Actinomadura rayongensis TaxID=1429076 RepID=A0A6I4W7L1_9ACTN|nr:Clp protease N-terminal domain-containing protein [Actinomadura rayongensis]MXQ64186.1 hypothetical protein [Actinomadura rayongensis]